MSNARRDCFGNVDRKSIPIPLLRDKILVTKIESQPGCSVHLAGRFVFPPAKYRFTVASFVAAFRCHVFAFLEQRTRTLSFLSLSCVLIINSINQPYQFSYPI